MIELGPPSLAEERNMALEEAAVRTWDVLVAGAGPAGATVARQLAQRGASVLMVDRALHPRRKVCGGCLNRASLSALEKAGLGGIAMRLGARPLTAINDSKPSEKHPFACAYNPKRACLWCTTRLPRSPLRAAER